MLDAKDLNKYIVKYGVNKDLVVKETESFDNYISKCRRFINEKTPSEYHNWESSKQDDFTKKLIIGYVQSHTVPVEGYIENEGLRVDKLIDDITTSIMDFGILRKALDDETIQEIQVNDKDTIYIVRGGKTELYVDDENKPYRFASNEELKNTLYRMSISDNGSNTKRLTTEDPLLNVRASGSGYRISATNDSAITRDAAPYDYPVTSITIRKFSKSRLDLDTLTSYGSMSPAMAKFLRIIVKSDTRGLIVGPVSSGKTTVLNAVLWEADKNARIYLIQNPTEIVLYDRSLMGTNKRNVIHVEAIDFDSDKVSPTKNSMSNCIAHSLRNTPDIIVPGECRTSPEFYELYRTYLTGHRAWGTYHSMGAIRALERMSNEISIHTGGNKSEYFLSCAEYVDCIISQSKLADGNRRVMGIELPYVENGVVKAKQLFKYVLDREVVRDDKGNILEIKGHFEQTGHIDKDGEFAELLYRAGYVEDDIREFI